MSKTSTKADDKLLRVLRQIGLDEKESRIYLAALSLGPASIIKIADLAEVKRTTVYSVLSALKQQGLVSVEVRGFKRRYVAAPPSALRAVVANKLTTLDEAMSDFTAKYNMAGGGGIIRQYQGLSATKGLYEELLSAVKTNDPYYVLTDLARWETIDTRFFVDFVKRRARKNVKLKVLTTQSKAAIRRLASAVDADTTEQVRLLPTGMMITTNLIITPQHVVFHQLVPPMDAILLNNRSVISLQSELFIALWNSCEA